LWRPIFNRPVETRPIENRPPQTASKLDWRACRDPSRHASIRCAGHGLALGQLAEVVFDGLAVRGGQAAGQVLQRIAALPLGQVAPALLQIAELPLIHVSRTAISCNLAILHRTARIRSARRTAGLAAVGSATAVGSGSRFFGFVLQFFDKLVQAEDNLLLQLLSMGTTTGQFQTALDIAHLPGHVA